MTGREESPESLDLFGPSRKSPCPQFGAHQLDPLFESLFPRRWRPETDAAELLLGQHRPVGSKRLRKLARHRDAIAVVNCPSEFTHHERIGHRPTLPRHLVGIVAQVLRFLWHPWDIVPQIAFCLFFCGFSSHMISLLNFESGASGWSPLFWDLAVAAASSRSTLNDWQLNSRGNLNGIFWPDRVFNALRNHVDVSCSEVPNVGLRLHSPTEGSDPVVITGIGVVTSLGMDREGVWDAVCRGESGVRRLAPDDGYPSCLAIAAVVDLPSHSQRLKVIRLAELAAREALGDAGAMSESIDRERFGCAISGHMGDARWMANHSVCGDPPWWDQFLPNSACSSLATRHRLLGPRLCHSTACASGLVDFLSAVRAIQDGQCDIALTGSAEAIDPLFAAGFKKMRVLAEDDDPTRACRPFDRTRQGFVMGEGAAMFVVERLSHALARRAPIYAEVCAGRMLADAHHVTGLDVESDSLVYLIHATLRRGRLTPDHIGYINAHGTGTAQNDLLEIRGIRKALGSAADQLCVSANKSMLGHLVNAAGSVELALTTLALRDHFVPPTLNLTDPDPECNLDCLPHVGRQLAVQHALKLSIAFGGHLVGVLLRRWDDAATGRVAPAERRAA